MRAVVLDRPGPATSLQVRVVPVPETAPGRELLRAAGKLVVLTGDGAG
jgi:NADPH:quinone reductase-like Zn-dependent oxidoreductase